MHRNDFIHMLRGLAALSVAAFHICKHTQHPSEALAVVRSVTVYGWLGVPVFFVISGFVITNSLRSAWVTPSYAGNYILRRVVRLDPPYWTTIFVAILYFAALSVVLGEPLNLPPWQSVAAHLFYLQNLLGFEDISVGFWTLCLEVQFYLSMLALLAVCQRTGIALPLAVSVLGAGSLLLSPDIHYGASSIWADAYRSLAPNFSMFAVGILAWMRVTDRIGPRWWLLVNLVCLGRLMVWFDIEVAVALLIGDVIVLNARGKLPVPKLSGMMLLGTISYSLYVSHPLTSRALQLGTRKLTGFDGDASLLMCIFVILVSIAVAWVMYRLIERPSMLLSESLKKRIRPAPSAAPAAAIASES